MPDTATMTRFRLIMPEFADQTVYTSELLDVVISDASLEPSVEIWGSLWTIGVFNLAAHKLALWKRSQAAVGNAFGASVGGVNSIRTGDEQINFGAVGAATASGADASLKTTPYGLEYIRLRDNLVSAPLVV